MKTLVIIPAYNEQAAILSTVRSLEQQCPDVDYVVINDCSRDDTKSILERNNINHINLPINLGIGGGVQTGYIYARDHGYDIAIQFDGDGQHRADYLHTVMKPIEDGQANMVIGSRFVSGTGEGFQSSGARRMGISILSKLIRLCTGKTILDVTSGFRAADRGLIHYFAENYAQDYPEPQAIVSAITAGYTVTEVPVMMSERNGGVSSIRALRSVYYMIKVSLAILVFGFQFSKGGKQS